MGCEWLYAIHEEYGYLALRNICFQILSLLLLLTYVKDESDLLLYAWSTVASKVTALLKQFLGAMIVVTVPRLASGLLGCLYDYLVCQAALAKGIGPGATVFWAALWAIPGYFVILYLLGNLVLLEFKREGRRE